jgi:hypothetical protein
MSKNLLRMNRRTLLKAGLAGSALAAFPWLLQAGRAQERTPKLILFFTPHGTVWDRWRPTGGERDFTPSPILMPLDRHREQVVIVDGIRIENGTPYYIPHTYTMPVLWTGSPIDVAASGFCREDHMQCYGWNTGVSVDQYIASMLPRTTPYGSIELGHRSGGAHPASRMIYTGPATPKTPLNGAEAAWNVLFGATVPDGTAARRHRVLSTVHEDFASRRGRLSANDRARLDAHANALEELERTLVPPTALCERPTLPVVTEETAIDRQSDLLAASLGCGLTNVASFQVTIADNDNGLYPWLGINASGHHTMSHDSSPETQSTLAGLYTWYAERFAYLLDRLANTPDVGGTSVLDNSLVIWGSELGIAWTHDISNVPFVLAGGAAERLGGGRYLRLSDGTQLNRLLVSACHAMGLNETETYGSLDRGAGPIPGLFT